MFKKYKAFMNNEGKFEQPGARALQDFINLYNQQLEADRIALAAQAAEARARVAEEQAREAEQRATQAERPSAEDVTRERFFPETIHPRVVEPPVKPEPKPGGKTCTICSSVCQICPNPWQRTRSDRMVSKVVDINLARALVLYGTALKPCNHVFCGACLAQAIYHALNMAFDRATYGTVLPSYEAPGLGPAEFPIFCPTCPGKPREKSIEISDQTAQLVLGEPNMDEWKYARFLSRLNIIHCPHKGCNEAFDGAEILPAPGVHEPTHVQCPRCKGSLCKACKVVWHEKLTCLIYQASPVLPENTIPKSGRPSSAHRRPMLHSPGYSPHGPGKYSHNPGNSPLSPRPSPDSPGKPTLGPGRYPWAHGDQKNLALSPGNSPLSSGNSPQSPGDSPHSQGRYPWARGEQNVLAH